MWTRLIWFVGAVFVLTALLYPRLGGTRWNAGEVKPADAEAPLPNLGGAEPAGWVFGRLVGVSPEVYAGPGQAPAVPGRSAQLPAPTSFR